MTPDVCCVADPNTPVYIIINYKGYTIGGTSLASPLYAGMLSLLTQTRLNNKKSTYTSVLNKSNSLQPLLYNSSDSTSFFDVTSGITSVYIAATGFDIASGKGVINLPNVIQKLG